MLSWFASASEAMLLLPIAIVASWVARTLVRTLTRRAVRRAQRSEGSWRVRLDRLGDDGQADARKRQRADSVAKMIGRFMTVLIFTVATFAALELMGVSMAFAISSAGFIGLALALSGQDLVKDFLAGTRALLEDRYAVGDDVDLARRRRRGARHRRPDRERVGATPHARGRHLARRAPRRRIGHQPVAAAGGE